MTQWEGSQLRAAAKAVAIVAYFVVTVVWLPSRILDLGAMRDSPQWVIDVVGTGVWVFFLALGIWMLRQAQRRGYI